MYLLKDYSIRKVKAMSKYVKLFDYIYSKVNHCLSKQYQILFEESNTSNHFLLHNSAATMAFKGSFKYDLERVSRQPYSSVLLVEYTILTAKRFPSTPLHWESPSCISIKNYTQLNSLKIPILAKWLSYGPSSCSFHPHWSRRWFSIVNKVVTGF